MKKLIQRLPNRFWVSSVEHARRQPVNCAVARIAQRDEVFETVVAALPIIAKSDAIDVVNVRGLVVSALHAFEAITLQCFKVVTMAVLGDELRPIRATGRTVEISRAIAGLQRSADTAGKGDLTSSASLGPRVARMKFLATPIAWLRVLFELPIAPVSAARFAPRLEFVKDAERSSAVDAITKCVRRFHAQKLANGAG